MTSKIEHTPHGLAAVVTTTASSGTSRTPPGVKQAAQRVFRSGSQQPHSGNRSQTQNTGSSTPVIVHRRKESPPNQSPISPDPTEKKTPPPSSKQTPPPLPRSGSVPGYMKTTAASKSKKVDPKTQVENPDTPPKIVQRRNPVARSATQLDLSRVPRGDLTPNLSGTPKKNAIDLSPLIPLPSSSTPPDSPDSAQDLLIIAPAITVGSSSSLMSKPELEEERLPNQPLTPLRGSSALKPDSPQPPHTPVPTLDITGIRKRLHKMRNGTTSGSADGALSPVRQGRIEIPDSMRQAMSLEAQQLMEAALKGDHDFLPQLPKPAPSTEQSVAVVKPAPKIVVDTINSATLNVLFPVQLAPPRKTVRLDDDTIFDLEPVYASPQQILDLELTEEEVQVVKRICFWRSMVTDEQLGAILKRFIHVDEIRLSLCSELTDAIFVNLVDRKLKSIQIYMIPKITTKGLRSLKYDQLEEFSFSTKERLGKAEMSLIADSPVLKSVDLNFCTNLTPEGLLAFNMAHEFQAIVISVKGCDQITEETVTELNRDREKPILVKMGPTDSSDRVVSGLPRLLTPPPEVPESNDVLSNASIPRLFMNRNPYILPNRDTIEQIQPTHLRGINLTGSIPYESLEALVSLNPDMQVVRVYDSNDFNHSALLLLYQQLKKCKTLYLGKLPQISSKSIELTFSQKWEELTDLHLSEMPITDLSLQTIATFPKLTHLNIDCCDRFTVQGLHHLMGCRSLQHLSIRNCPSIDLLAIREFRQKRPDVQLIASQEPDPTVVKMAVQEANVVMWHPTMQRLFAFFPPERKEPIFTSEQVAYDEAITEHYRNLLAPLGIQVTTDAEAEYFKDWMMFDQILQSYLNLSRAAWAIRSELIRVGFFTNQDPDQPPETVEEIIQLLRVKNLESLNPYVKKVRILDFTGLNLSRMPEFITEQQWQQLRTIKLNGTLIEALSQQFKASCPKLSLVEFPGGRKDELEALLSPRTNHLAPPREMTERPPEVPDSKDEAPQPPKRSGFMKKLTSLFKKND